MLGAFHPDRIDGVVAIAPTHTWTIPHPNREASYAGMFDRVENPQGWDKYNTHYWRENWEDFVKFFFAECCSDPHSTKLWDDTTSWAMETDGELIVLAGEGKEQICYDDMKAAVTSMPMPVLIIHGTDDRVVSYESSLRLQKRIPHARLLTMEGVGHLPTGRYPVRINNAIKAFADETYGRNETSAPADDAIRAKRATKEGVGDLIADRSRPRSPRRRHLSRASTASPRSRGRVARTRPGDESARPTPARPSIQHRR